MNYIWIPLLVLVSIILSIFSNKHNEELINVNYRIIFLFIIGFFNSSVWILMTKLTKNIIFDSLMYSVVISITCTLTYFILGCGSKFTNVQWIGTFLVLIGFILMRFKL